MREHCFLFHLPRALMQSEHRSRCWILCVVRVASLPCKALLAGHAGCLGSLLAAALQAVAGGADCGSEKKGRAAGSQV